MKRKIIGFSFLIVLYTLTFGASINITSPKSGDVWCINQEHSIEWEVDGPLDVNVRIRLLNHPSLTVALAIVNSTPNDEPYLWTIPSTVTPGFYRIRVRSIDGAVWQDGEMFEISDCSTPDPDVRQPDLAISFFEIFPKKDWLVVTQPVDCRLVVKNIGNVISRECHGNIEVIQRLIVFFA